MRIRNWTIAQRIAALLVVAVGVIVVLAIGFWLELQRVSDCLAKISQQATPATAAGTQEGVALVFHIQTVICVVVPLAAGLTVVIGIMITRGISRGLRRPMADLSEGAEQTSTASTEVTAASQTLAEGVTTQAASLEETSASLEEIASMTKRNAANAQSTKDLADKTKSEAEAGANDMALMIQAMQEIKSSSDDIGKIIKTIDEIAFQTNILALNAAIEAAKAGEAGIGFAAVADEVRNLAQRSAQAAKETATKIETAISKTCQGVQMSRKVSEGLAGIVNNVRLVDKLLAEIATASREQSEGINQVNEAVAQMDRIVQSNAATAQESSSAAQEMSAYARVLRGVVEELQSLTGASPAEPSPNGDNGNGWNIAKARATGRQPAKSPHRNGHSQRSPAPALAGSSRHAPSELPLEDDFKDF